MADLGVALGRAADVVRAHLAPTPLVRARSLDALLKLESLQQTGAYKVRGALSALSAAVARGDCRPVVAASAGNHSAGLAWAARALGLTAVAVVPVHAPENKVERTRRLGARVLRFGDTYEAAERRARQLAHRNGWRFLHAFDDPDIIAGQATVGLELRAAEPDVVVVPVGGGGLAAGVALAFAETRTRVIGVRVREAERMASIADGVRVRQLGIRTRALLQRHLDGWVEVSEAEVRRAMRRLYRDEGWIAEGAGAVAVAGLERVEACHRVAVVTGGNVDAALFRAVVGEPELRAQGA